MIKKIGHILLVAFLTLLTQIGGVIWMLTYIYINTRRPSIKWYTKLSSFLLIYTIFTYLLIPPVAKLSGRVPLPITKKTNLTAHNALTHFLNRHYVKPRLKSELIKVSKEMNKISPNLTLSYLDANFPFVDGFPLLPHLSHKDGRKVDLSFYYLKDDKQVNLKPSRSGYGVYVEPSRSEINQTHLCLKNGHWQYEFSKYMTLGSRDDLVFDQKTSKRLIENLLKSKGAQKLFIEPHLKTRMQISNSKVRFQGCHSVRHDDHIHFQIN